MVILTPSYTKTTSEPSHTKTSSEPILSSSCYFAIIIVLIISVATLTIRIASMTIILAIGAGPS